MTTLDDAAIVRRVLAGDADAYGLIVERYYDRYARFAVHMVGNREDAEEALQDAFLRAYHALGRYEERERFAGWLLRIVVNECRTVAARGRRREHRFPRLEPAAWDAVAATQAAGEAPDEASERAALREALARGLARLPREQREALLLKYTEGLSYDEIAAATGAGTSALKMRVKRACERLREILVGAACV